MRPGISKPDGALSVKELSEESVVRANPVKIGDFIQIDTTPFWVAGIDLDGELLVVTRSGQRIDPVELASRLRRVVEEHDAEVTVQMSNADRQRLLGTEETPVSLSKPMPTLFHTSHPGLCAALRRDPAWRQVSAELYGANKRRSAGSMRRSAARGKMATGHGYGGHFRAVQGFRYLGGARAST